MEKVLTQSFIILCRSYYISSNFSNVSKSVSIVTASHFCLKLTGNYYPATAGLLSTGELPGGQFFRLLWIKKIHIPILILPNGHWSAAALTGFHTIAGWYRLCRSFRQFLSYTDGAYRLLPWRLSDPFRHTSAVSGYMPRFVPDGSVHFGYRSSDGLPHTPAVVAS